MNVLIFEWKNFGIEDICDAFKDMAIKYKCISTELMRERKNEEFDNIFENEDFEDSDEEMEESDELNED